MKNKPAISLFFILIPMLLFAQNKPAYDYVYLQSGKTISGHLNGIFSTTLAITTDDKEIGIALFMVDSVYLARRGIIYARDTGFYPPADSLNKYISKQNNLNRVPSTQSLNLGLEIWGRSIVGGTTVGYLLDDKYYFDIGYANGSALFYHVKNFVFL